MDQQLTPLFDQLNKHKDSRPQSFHVPGHKNGRVFLEKARPAYEQILAFDQTEIQGLDDLHDATGVIAEAQQLAAELYGSKTTHFLVGGSTVGNLAMMLCVAEPGDQVMVQRNSHQSIFHGMELAGLKPVFLEPERDEATGIALGVSMTTIKLAMSKYSGAKAVFLTNPSYEGYGQDLTLHVQAAHEANMIVCVDEAHGAHLIIDHPSWPVSSLKARADLVVQSAHKTLPAMTMTSFLHNNSERINSDKIRLYLRMLQSSSPSYPLMASLDVARAYLASFEISDWNQLTAKIAELKECLGGGDGWGQTPHKLGDYVQDPLKLAFVTPYRDAAIGWKNQLKARGAFPELVSPGLLLFTLPLNADAIDVDNLRSMLEQILPVKNKKRGHLSRNTAQPKELISELALSYQEMRERKTVLIPWQESEGKIAGETIVPYPPGIPLVLAGERIREDQLETLAKLINEGSSFQTGDSWVYNGITIFLE
ncbi:aminotransferase class I/II-fold pyridoxal phosphate-dependent enzyme [Salipaludibacillus neizhouensis]|nr:aminotransferase class I/II-fold pyridoxal phosphate-dependent enzyme [Salipaludibacillus neizhouensis]